MGKVRPSTWILSFTALISFTCSVSAQLGGHNTKGDFGLQSGTQAPPGWYLLAPMVYHYVADEFRDGNGDRVTALEGGGSVEATAWVAGLIWVADFKVLGANYGLSVYPGVTNNALEFPPLGQDEGDLSIPPNWVIAHVAQRDSVVMQRHRGLGLDRAHHLGSTC